MIVYTLPGCTACDFTKKKLDKLGAKYEVREFDDEAMALAKEKGYSAAPVVVVGDVSWSGLRVNLIQEHAVLG